MTERELIEKAAKALLLPENYNNAAYMRGFYSNWNPLVNARDCADMEARLMIDVEWWDKGVECSNQLPQFEPFVEMFASHNNDRQRARMMASTRAAAALGESM